jgi:hypothetical protein
VVHPLAKGSRLAVLFFYRTITYFWRRYLMWPQLVEYFNKQPRIGTLSTANGDGKVDVACFGSPRMLDGKTVVMVVRKNRTFANLQENPSAVFMIMEPGKTPPEWKGVRVYLQRTEIETSGKKLEMMKKNIARILGEEAAETFHAAITFNIQDVRPLVDTGQGWERSIEP